MSFVPEIIRPVYPTQKSSLEKSRELLCDRITDLGSAGAAANVFGADVVVDDGLDSLVDFGGQLGLLEGVLEHHAH